MHLKPVSQQDLPDFARVCGRAMWEDEVMAYIAPRKDKYPDSFFRYTLHRAKIRYYRGELLFLAITDDTDPDWTGEEVVMGYCGYSTNLKDYITPVRGGCLGNAFERFALDVQGRYSRLFGLDWSSDVAAEDHFRRVLATDYLEPYFDSLPEDLRNRVNGQHWELELLGTHPSFRRRGVGKMMLQWGFDRARRDQVPLTLTASIAGERLYLNTGFREVSRISILPDSSMLKELDLGMGKGKGLSWANMVWEPEWILGQDIESSTPE